MGKSKRTIEQLAKELKIELPKQKLFIVADIHALLKMVSIGTISYDRMVELMNIKAEQFYKQKKTKK